MDSETLGPSGDSSSQAIGEGFGVEVLNNSRRRWTGFSSVLNKGHVQTYALVVLGILAIVFPFFMHNPRWMSLVTFVFIYMVLATGLNIVVGFTGLLNLGYIAFYAIGSYYTAIILVTVAKNMFGLDITQIWWLGWINMLVGGLLAAIVGAILGYPTLRLRGDYLAIMTLGFGEIVRIVALNWIGLTRGPSGIRGIPHPAVGSLILNKPTHLYFLAIALLIFTLFAAQRLVKSRVGRAWTAIREDQIAASAMGVHIARYKLLSFAVGAFFAGMMGSFFAMYINYISPSSFQLMESITVLCLVVLGGMGTLAGPAVGAAVWIAINEWLKDFSFVVAHPELRGVAMGLMLVLVTLLRPSGIVGRRRPSLQMTTWLHKSGGD